MYFHFRAVKPEAADWFVSNSRFYICLVTVFSCVFYLQLAPGYICKTTMPNWDIMNRVPQGISPSVASKR